MNPAKSAIHQCPCGENHLVNSIVAQRITTRGPTLPVLNKHGAWYVPCVYAAVHGISPDLIRDAAAQYGFTPLHARRPARSRQPATTRR